MLGAFLAGVPVQPVLFKYPKVSIISFLHSYVAIQFPIVIQVMEQIKFFYNVCYFVFFVCNMYDYPACCNHILCEFDFFIIFILRSWISFLEIYVMILSDLSLPPEDTPIKAVYRCPRFFAIKFFINTIHDLNISISLF